MQQIFRGCYEVAQKWLADAENRGSTGNRANQVIRILMQFSSLVHNTLYEGLVPGLCKSAKNVAWLPEPELQYPALLRVCNP